MTASGEIQIDTSALATNTNSCTSILINMLFFKACSKYTVHDKCTTYALGKGNNNKNNNKFVLFLNHLSPNKDVIIGEIVLSKWKLWLQLNK